MDPDYWLIAGIFKGTDMTTEAASLRWSRRSLTNTNGWKSETKRRRLIAHNHLDSLISLLRAFYTGRITLNHLLANFLELCGYSVYHYAVHSNDYIFPTE